MKPNDNEFPRGSDNDTNEPELSAKLDELERNLEALGAYPSEDTLGTLWDDIHLITYDVGIALIRPSFTQAETLRSRVSDFSKKAEAAFSALSDKNAQGHLTKILTDLEAAAGVTSESTPGLSS